MTSRESKNEDDVQVAGVLITKGDIMRYWHSFQLASTSKDPFNRTTLALVDLWDFSWLGWIALETSFPESPRSLKTEFGVKRYDVFREVTCAVSESYGSAAHKGGSTAPVQVLMASF